MKSCGQNCACAHPTEGAILDKEGLCPCGRSKAECCHSDETEGKSALHELCDEHNGKHVCDIDSDLQKTAP